MPTWIAKLMVNFVTNFLSRRAARAHRAIHWVEFGVATT